MIKKKVVKCIFTIALIMSFLCNLFLINHLNKAYKEIDATLSEKISDLCSEMDSIEALTLSYDNTLSEQNLKKIGNQLYENCYDKAAEISQYKSLSMAYSALDFGDFQGFIFEFVTLQPDLNEEEILELKNSILDLCVLFKSLHIPSNYNFRKDSKELTAKLEAISTFCLKFCIKQKES
ncbi:MAG: hypothetical protein U0M21_08395 [Emergencia sp.]|nr:hypothetical protein [Emergencia sp.]